MICASNPCGCAIKTSSLTISGSGNQGDPWVIDTDAFIICTSSTRPTPSRVGVSIYETDTKRYLTWDGTFWVIMGGAFPEVICTTLTTNTPITIADSSTDAWVLANEVVDSDGFHTGTSNVFTVPAGLGGDYDLSLFAQWVNNANGYRLILANIGSNTTTATEIPLYRDSLFPTVNTSNTYHSMGVGSLRLEAGATVTITSYQTSGAPLNILSARASLVMTRHIPSLV